MFYFLRKYDFFILLFSLIVLMEVAPKDYIDTFMFITFLTILGLWRYFLSTSRWYELDADFYNKIIDLLDIPNSGFKMARHFDIVLPQYLAFRYSRKNKLQLVIPFSRLKFNITNLFPAYVGIRRTVLLNRSLYLELAVNVAPLAQNSFIYRKYRNFINKYATVGRPELRLVSRLLPDKTATVLVTIYLGTFYKGTSLLTMSYVKNRLDSLQAESTYLEQL